MLTGNDGMNVLLGGGTNDRLIGGDTYDRLTGGAGTDIFVLEPRFSSRFDIITDFVSRTDRILIADSGLSGTGAITVQTGPDR